MSARKTTSSPGSTLQRTTAKARERSSPLELAQDALGVVTWIWDARRDRVRWFGDLSPLLGLPGGRFSGRFEEYLEFVHAEDRQRARRTYVECIKGVRRAYRSEERVVWPDGSVRWLETHGRGRYDARGRARELCGVVRDCTERIAQQRALTESEERFEKAFHSSQEAIGITRLSDARIVAVNRRMEELYGAPALEMLGRSSIELGLWAGGAAMRERLLATLRDERRIRDLEIEVRTRHGEVRACSYSADLIEIAGELHAIGFLRDVTEHRRAEAQARQSLGKYSTLFSTSLVGMMVTRPGDRRIVEINDTALELIGMTREQALGARTVEIDQRPEGLAAADYIRAKALAGESVIDHPVQFVRRDGRQVEALLTASPVELEGETHIVISARDVTDERRLERERQQAQSALAASEHRYRSLFEAAMDCIIVIAPDGTLLDINDYGCRSLGYTKGELCNGSFTRILDETKLRRLLPRPGGVQRERRSLRAEQEVRAKDGSVRSVEFAAGPLPDGNVLVIVRDVSERRQNEARVHDLNASLERRVAERTAELEAANRELESFSFSVSHDLRAPLRAIAGFSGILRRTHASEFTGEALRLIGRVESNALRMGELIEDLLEFSRMGRAPLERRMVDMRRLVESVMRDLPPAVEGQLQIVIGELPPVSGDSGLLRQVWQNLIGNAVKFSRHAKPPRLEIGSVRRGGAIEYHVSDNGAGFDMTYASRLFGVFQRLHGQDEFEGTGVGLAIVQRIVHRHGGEVSAYGEPGRGATIRFTLPAA